MSGSNSAERKRHEPLVLVETADLSEEDWLDYRRRGIGGSDVSAIFGTSPFRTARDLYYDKLNIASVEDDEGNWVAMEMGHLLEPLVAKIFERKTGYRVYQIKKMFQHPQYPWMLADVDYFVELPDGTTAILEIKTTNYNARDNWWMNGKETVPVYYESQGRHYMAVTDIDRCFFCCLYGNNEEEVIIREVKRDFEYEAEMVFLSVITGSPGTGKTTVLRTILEVYRRLHPDGKIALMAPTGRASRRMSESTGFEDARTLHSGLGLTSEEDEGSQNRKSELLSADLIIVDEFSMVDMWLAEKFFERMKANARIVLVGDPDQLPSVGAGNVFREIIETQIVPVTVLDQIFRQSKDSLIAYNAKFINEGNTKLFYGPDFVFVSGDSQEDTAEKITERYCLEIQESGIENVQILSPFRSEGAASSEQLNETIRELVNPFRSAEEEIKFGPKIFRINDRIMQTKNTEKVSNGDLGFIRYIKDTDQGKKIGMDFGAGRTLEYGVDDLSNVDLAYATTIHKAMGSEYETVIMPLLKAHTIMMYRNLLYTGITRAKKRVVLIGQKQVLFMAIHRNEIGKRNTLLGMRIQMYFKAYAKKAGIPIPAALEEQLKNAS